MLLVALVQQVQLAELKTWVSEMEFCQTVLLQKAVETYMHLLNTLYLATDSARNAIVFFQINDLARCSFDALFAM